MDRCYSYSDLLKLRYNYDKIVTGTSGVERGNNRTFYPVYNKFMYLLDKNALKHSFNTNGNTNNNTRATSPTAAQIPLNSAGQQQSVHRINSHINFDLPYTSPVGDSVVFSPNSSQQLSHSPPNNGRHTSPTAIKHGSQFTFGSLDNGTLTDSMKPSNTFLNDSLNVEGGSSTYLNKLVKKLTSGSVPLPPSVLSSPKRQIIYFEPSKNEVALSLSLFSSLSSLSSSSSSLP